MAHDGILWDSSCLEAPCNKWHGVNYGNRFIPEDWMRCEFWGGYLAFLSRFIQIEELERIRVELAFRQELVLMFAPAGNICSLLAFGATASFLSPFVRPSTVSFIHPSIHWLFKICTYLKCGYLSHPWLPLLRAGSINAYVLEASLQFLPACPPKRTTGSFMGFKRTRSKTKAGNPADRLFGYFDCSSLVSFVL